VCTMRLLQLIGSMKHSTIHQQLKKEYSGSGCLFVGIGHFDDSSNTDRLFDEELRASFPLNYTKSDTKALSIISLLDVGVSTT
jgi:hypothetical protein